MAAVPSVKVLKTGPYKGGIRTWSNRYHFNGGTPADATHWHTLMDAVTTAEALALAIDTTIVEAIGYAAGSDVPITNKVYAVAGSVAIASGDWIAPGDTAALVRYSTASKTTKNHPIYLFNYYHQAVISSTAGSGDKLATDQKNALETYATAWITGFTDGTITAVRAGPNGQAATGSLVEEWVTHRDFPYLTSV